MKQRCLFCLDGEVAVVTGAFGNLGSTWTEALLWAGARVAALDLESVIASEKQRILQKKFGKKSLKFYKADVTDIGGLKRVRKQIVKEWGSVGILVNNAGIDAPPVKIEKKNKRSKRLENIAQKMWEVNVYGIINCMEVFGSEMIKKKSGSIINIGSLYATVSPDHRLYIHLNFDKCWAYGATKSAVVQLTKYYATRWGKFGVRVNCLSPGGVIAGQDKIFIEKYSVRVPIGRMTEKEDLEGPLVFLASDASSYITGINLEVNGGFTAW